MNKQIIFGTDGWRGLLDKEINHNSVEIVAQAFSDYLLSSFENSPELKVAIGYDGRRYSDEFAVLFSKVLSGNGITAFLSDKIIPTPVLSYFVKANSLSAGVMITASHNPSNYNGIKFKGPYGGPFTTEETLKVEEVLEKNPIQKNDFNVLRIDFVDTYFNQLANFIDFSVLRGAGINILIDSMGGAGQNYLESIVKKFGCRAKTIYGTAHNDFYRRSPEPIEKNLGPLKEYLKDNPGFSFGAATDGDADRCGILLEDGSWLSAQYTILLLTDYLVNQKKVSGNLVKTSSVTDKVRLFKSSDRKVLDVQVGFKYICEMMISDDVAIGCEESGGYGFKNHIPERDGILSILIIAEMLAKSGFKNLSEYFNGLKCKYGNIYYDRIDYKYENPDRTEILPCLFQNPPESLLEFKIIDILEFYSSRGIVNGLKFLLAGNSGWILLRASETEPLVRIYAESDSDEKVMNLLNAGVDFFQKRS